MTTTTRLSGDRELLEMAAKAAGFCVVWIGWMEDPTMRVSLDRVQWRDWNPLTSDADAFRLAVKLNIHITSSATDAWASTLLVTATEPMGKDPLAATRRAVVLAAAEIGKSMSPLEKTKS